MTDSSAEIAQRVKRRFGTVAGGLAAGMLAMHDLLRKRPEDAAVVQEADAGAPPNIDEFGVQFEVYDASVAVPPLAPLPSSQRPRRGEPIV